VSADAITTVLQRMVEGASSILTVTKTGLPNTRPREGEDWIVCLLINRSILIARNGALFRQLFHTLAECYHQHAFAGNQVFIKHHLHVGLMAAHDNLDSCEVPHCPWVSHECAMNTLGVGRCTSLLEHVVNQEHITGLASTNETIYHPRLPSLPEPPYLSGHLTAARQWIPTSIRKLIGGATAVGQCDEEEGTVRVHDPHHAMELSQMTPRRNPDTHLATVSLAGGVSSSAIHEGGDVNPTRTTHASQSEALESMALHNSQIDILDAAAMLSVSPLQQADGSGNDNPQSRGYTHLALSGKPDIIRSSRSDITGEVNGIRPIIDSSN
jgi:hypothetical protein